MRRLLQGVYFAALPKDLVKPVEVAIEKATFYHKLLAITRLASTISFSLNYYSRLIAKRYQTFISLSPTAFFRATSTLCNDYGLRYTTMDPHCTRKTSYTKELM